MSPLLKRHERFLLRRRLSELIMITLKEGVDRVWTTSELFFMSSPALWALV
ncbi:hypothetical protein UUU_02780 [Klebsiella pneumoniae subsp. pneumoniae DSM 30104 = JCM 1662 = NBRC 14940]|nr:hypothetical protein UUU_02780 [Klebsiella pneumoniae subsp. pneumoniae DSM 30104 = JCM 1662 = NBRC 14940]